MTELTDVLDTAFGVSTVPADCLEGTAGPPEGEYAIVELFGHTTLVGRIAEVERFGSKMLAIEPVFQDALLPVVFCGGASIYRLTPCSGAVAWAKQARHSYALPASVRAIVPPLVLAASEVRPIAATHEGHHHDVDEGDRED